MVIISSTFTADPIKKSLTFFLEKFNFIEKHKIELTPYNQVFQEIESYHSITAQNSDGINVFIIKLDDFLRFQKNTLTKHEIINTVQHEMDRFSKNLVSKARSMSAASFIVIICHSVDNIIREADINIISSFRDALAKASNIYLITESDISQTLTVDDYFEHITDANGHIPFVLEYYNVLGYLLTRKIFDIELLNQRPLKAIILDCDNTLWKGVCGEVGAKSVEITPPYLFFQRLVKEQKERGVLICLCSKNNEKDVFEVFDVKKNDMPLKLEDIVAYKINWNLKSDNVRELLDFLGFSEQNVVFIDDRRDECLEIQKSFPDILTIELPDEKNICSFFTNTWVFDHLKKATKEDKDRTSIYQKKFNLNYIDKAYDGLLSNQHDHNTIVDLIELSPNDIKSDIIQRVADLTSRTNQFNLQKKIYSEAQIMSFVEQKDSHILLADVKDCNNNEYGLTGLVMFSIHGHVLSIDTFLLSCRIIGKNVERAILNKLVEIAKQNNLTSVSIPFISTEKNKPAEYFIKSIVGIYRTNDYKEALHLYLLDINQDTSINYHLPIINKIEPLKKTYKTKNFNLYNAEIIDIAKNYAMYINSLEYGAISYQNNDIEMGLLDILNKVCRQKISSVDAGFVSSGIDSFELMMFLAQIYRHYKAKIDMMELYKLDDVNIGIIAKMIQKNQIITDTDPQKNIPSPSLLSLSAAQKALWLEKLKMQNDSLYNLFRVFHIKGKLDILKLERAFKLVIEKHECLRTVFLTQESSIWPVCQVLLSKTSDFKLQVEKKAITSIDDISLIIRSLVQKPFDLEASPAIRVNLIITSPDECYLLIVMHHIICDGWSFSRLVNEVVFAYNDKNNEPSQPQPYSKFVEWQQEQMPISDINSEFLKTHFLNYPIMNLPYDFNKPKVNSYNGQHISFELSCALTSRLHEISAQCNTTLYETMLSMYMVFLAKICNQTDISLASIISTRPQEYFDTVGYMVNLITLRSDLSSNPDFLDFLAQTKSSFQASREIGDIPFLEIVKNYREYFEDIGDLIKVLFVFENFPSYELSLDNVQTQEVYCGNYLTLSLPNTSKFDLAFYLKEKESIEGNTVSGVVEFSTDVFKSETIETFIEMFEQLTKKIANNINKPVLNHSLLTSKEESVLTAWNMSVKKDFPRDRNVLKFFLDQARLYPHKIALVEENGQKITYSELNAASNKRALYLQNIGIDKGDVVAISLERSIEMIASLIAIIKLGAVYLAIDPTYPLERREYICKNAMAKLCIDQPLDISQIKEDANIINQSTKITDVFYIVYTSGSTGKPKGINTTNLAFCNLLDWFCRYYNLSFSTNTALVASEGFDAFGWQVWPYLACGATINIISKETFLDTEKFIELINKNNVSICFVPTVYTEILINSDHLSKFKTLEYLLTGGDKLNTFLPKSYPFKVINHYGVSECAVVSTFCEVSFIDRSILEKLPYNRPLIGKPINNTEIYILDSSKQQVPVGVWGELCISGIGVADGYVGDPCTSMHKFIKNNFNPYADYKLYLTGDVARFLHDGSIEYLNRLDNQIEIDGYRIEPVEVETTILEDVRIDQAVAMLHGDGGLSKQLVAYITLKNSTNGFISAAEIIDNLKKKLPLKMVPKHLMILDKLPITENGKIDRACLAKKEASMQKNEISINANNKLHMSILNIFSELLNEQPGNIDIAKSFFELGGDSITVLRLLNAIKKDFGVSVAISEAYKNSSIIYFASLVAKHQPQKIISTSCNMNNIDNLLITLRNGDKSKIPLFFMHPVGGTVFCYQEIVSYLNKNQTCYGIQYPSDSNNIVNLPKNIQELAAYYINFVKLIQPKGPYAIVGHSFGGMLAYEIAYQLHSSGEDILLVAILDTWVVSMLDKQKKQKLKRDIIQKYQDQYEDVFAEDPMVETRFIHMQNIGFVYQPPKFAHTINLFKANIKLPELVDIQDDTNFWSEFTNVNVHCVNGDHDSILEIDNAKYLADKLTDMLQGVEAYER